ncbi:fumarate hydratase [bacterium]|nr:fumarate hydratase [candidate division CSSED10-310 bacterium]
MDYNRLIRELIEPLKWSVTRLPASTLAALRHAEKVESAGAKVQVQAMLQAVEVSDRQQAPICQDTGTPAFYVRVGTRFPAFTTIDQLEPALRQAVKQATRDIPLRPNTVHPITGVNPGDNTGYRIPQIIWSIDGTDSMTLTYFPKGGGCSNMSRLVMMTPGKGLKGVKEIVLERIASMEGKPCPPTVVGVGLGGSDSMCMELAKKALLRPVGVSHPDPAIAALEKELKDKANQLGVGPMGVGGITTVLDVKFEIEYRHPASFPVGIAVQCWANRQISMNIKPDGSVEVLP